MALRPEDEGRIILLHNGDEIETFDDAGEAYRAGIQRFGAGNFNLREIGAANPPILMTVFAGTE